MQKSQSMQIKIERAEHKAECLYISLKMLAI